MTRRIAARVGNALIAHALGDKYPTRGLEYVLGWLMFVWSFRVVLPGPVMNGSPYKYFLAIAPEWFWGAMGVAFATSRIVALIRNGSWSPGPTNRAICAAIGFNFWLAFTALYFLAVSEGAPYFPFRHCFGVLALAELFCFAHCIQERALANQAVAAAAKASALTVPEDGG